jgi:hypothetical protein
MSFVKQIYAFLEVSEVFLRQARVERVSERCAALDEVDMTRSDWHDTGSALSAHHFISNGSAGDIGNQDGGVMPAYGQDGA